MRKIFIILSLIILGLIAIAAIAWTSRANLAAQFLSRHLNNTPVTLHTLEVSKTAALLDRFWIGNPPRFKTNTAFSAKTIDIESDFTQILKDPLLIQEILIQDILVGIEFGPKGKTNWDAILASHAPKKKKSRGYLIKKLILENLTVEVMQPNGQIKRYPTIARLELNNISSETGLPLAEIEKAIFNLMMQELIQRFNLNQLFENLQNIPGSPLKYFPNPFNTGSS